MAVRPRNRAVVRAADGDPASQFAPGSAPTDDGISTTWRGIVLVAAISLFIGLDVAWRAEIWTYPLAALILTAGFAGISSCAVLAATLRRPAAMRRLEGGVLGLGIMLYLASLPAMFPAGARQYSGDEGLLTDLAGTALSHRSDPYAMSWPHAFAGQDSGMTLTVSGHVVTRFEYPPVTMILDALARPFTHGLPTAGVVTIAALVLTAILMFFLLPSPWRAAAPMICFGFGLYASPARQGDATIVAVPLLMLALCRWTSIGSGGRLGRSGWLSAVCLGLAAATQQLTWFVGPFLVVAIFLVRRADLPIRTTARLVCAYSAIAAAAFAVVNIPFAVWNFGDWLGGIASPLTQGTFPSGQGLVGITSFFTGGSGALGYYNFAALLYAAALLACFGLYFRRLGPAVAILPWTILFFAVRGLESYYFLFVVLYVVALLTADHAVVGRAHLLGGRLRQRLRLDTAARAVVITALFLPAVACLAIAIGTSQPLRLTVAPPTATGRKHIIATLTVTAANVSGHGIAPHFVLRSGAPPSAFWIIKSGPLTLPPGATATYVIRAPFAAAARPASDRIELLALSADPATLSSVTITMGHSG